MLALTRLYALILLLPILLLVGCSGDDCDTVDCAPEHPPLFVTVLDSVSLTDTTLVMKVIDADVRLYIDNDAELLEYRSLLQELSDSTYRTIEQIDSDADLFAVVAERDGIRDTLTDLELQRVEGCCPRTLLGIYTINLAKAR